MSSLTADSIVYFPLINLPPSTWSAQAILYWDHIFVPVPEQASERFDELHNEPIMRSLLKSALVERVRPTDHLGRLTQLGSRFLEVLGEDPLLDERQARFNQGAEFALHEGKTGPVLIESGDAHGDLFGLHIDKATSNLFDGLQALGLGEPTDDWGWWLVERSVGYDYMALLAAELGDALGGVPTTDKREFLRPYGDPDRSVQLEAEILLAAVLPVPAEINVDKIVRFKESHRDDLRRFRQRVEELAQLIAWAPDDMREAKLRSAAEEVTAARHEVEVRMTERWFERILRHRLMAVVGLMIPGVSTARDWQEVLTTEPAQPRSALAYGAWAEKTL